jgi:hypothetical protein
MKEKGESSKAFTGNEPLIEKNYGDWPLYLFLVSLFRKVLIPKEPALVQ